MTTPPDTKPAKRMESEMKKQLTARQIRRAKGNRTSRKQARKAKGR